ncbi:hypothetical protein TD95_000581 [Thielaviopsis punctulata]|uniref:Uncharacterized protein n=1 Tax=Thielaviopsis punctulata TaxID=72032 RepID=A0A0F4ZLT6_9PEZI|nr:hypothetical protein TD95_000581 [Thielaviopsis punctulata]
MGCLCGKTDPDSFSSPGRVLGAAPPQGPRTASMPKTLASPRSGTAGLASPPPTITTTATAAVGAGAQGPPNEARQRAAEAASRRAQESKFKGRLGAQLDTQRRKSDKAILNEASNEAARARQLDATAETLRHN